MNNDNSNNINNNIIITTTTSKTTSSHSRLLVQNQTNKQSCRYVVLSFSHHVFFVFLFDGGAVLCGRSFLIDSWQTCGPVNGEGSFELIDFCCVVGRPSLLCQFNNLPTIIINNDNNTNGGGDDKVHRYYQDGRSLLFLTLPPTAPSSSPPNVSGGSCF